MKCQKCAKPATFHITDIVEKGKHREFHFCDEHARQHLAPAEDSLETPPISELAKKLIVSPPGALREPSAADKQVCPVCQITFLEFRKSGRLGCPYDYEVFRDELMPLLESIHGETRHSGKVPKRAPRNTQQQTTLIQLRNELKRAVVAEDYEAAARLRDKIKVDRARSRAVMTDRRLAASFRISGSLLPPRSCVHDLPAVQERGLGPPDRAGRRQAAGAASLPELCQEGRSGRCRRSLRTWPWTAWSRA